MTFLNSFVIFLNEGRILTFRFRRTGIISMDLPRITRINPWTLFRFVTNGLYVTSNRTNVSFFPFPIAIRSVRSSDSTSTRPPITSLTYNVCIMFIRNMSMAYVRSCMQVVTQRGLFVVRLDRCNILIHLRWEDVNLGDPFPRIVRFRILICIGREVFCAR